ncbi:MerR family transcriptional regulator [Streptomyces montanisoli]|uniref:MerR family transcriptional regulator n=1 Tax=Streptomyces montanisoli TaxID=2798581 RepID=A0A940MEE0_9ACTN|nr:MerR family transcriptional regulator [Streptomyces montanisoli]MBP0458067.1 MerR family transcriptional regulator [Streptomyces montanisoli]
MRVGELSRATGASTRSLRYYEDRGLLSSERRPNGYREYGEEAVRQVAFIQDLYRAGLPSRIIRDILPCTAPEPPAGDCTRLLARVREVRDELARQERQIAQRREMLDRYLAGTATPAGLGDLGRPGGDLGCGPR